MIHRIIAIGAFLLFAAPVFAYEKVQGWCEQGGTTVSVPGGAGPSTSRFQQSFRSCTVTVYDAGTLNVSTIYSDNAGTSKANPFTASSTGYWFFYSGNGKYDVKFSGGGISAPFTLGDFNVGGPTNDCADFPGSDAGAKINACVNSLPSTGGVADARGITGAQTISTEVVLNKSNVDVLLGEATFTMTKRVYIQASSVRLRGGGGGVTTLKASASIAYADNDLVLVSAGGVYPSPLSALSNVIVQDLTVDGNQANTTVGRPYADDTHGTGINLNRCGDCKVLNNIVKNVVYQAIVHTGNIAEDANDTEIAGNVVDSFGEVGIGVENHVNRADIHDNLVTTGIAIAENSNAGPAAGITVSCNSCTGNRIVDNQVRGNRIRNIVPVGGTVGAGIRIEDFADRTRIESNSVDHAQPCIRSIYLTAAKIPNNVIITNNTCYDSRSTDVGGIDVTAGATIPTGYMITMNNVSQSQGGCITVNGLSLSTIGSNNCINVGLGGGAETNGIAVYGSSLKNSIVGNTVSGAAGSAALINAAGATDNVLMGNILLSTGTALVDNGTRTGKWCNRTGVVDALCPISSGITVTGTGSFTGQVTSTLATGTAPLVITSTTPVANLSAVPTTYNAAGNQKTAAHIVIDNATIGGGNTVTVLLQGAAVFTDGMSYWCGFTNETGSRQPTITKTDGSHFTITGTAADTIDYVCVGS